MTARVPNGSSGFGERGFVLLAVLGLTGVIGAIALALSLSARDDSREMKLHLDLVKARLHADNALVRAIAALGDPADPLHSPLLRPGAKHSFKFNDVDVDLLIEFESGKIDLNRAEPEFILNALKRIAPDGQTAAAMHRRVMDFREQSTFIGDVGVMLSPAQRFDPVAGQIDRVFTVATGARGVSPALATGRAFPQGGKLPVEHPVALTNASMPIGTDTVLSAIPGVLPDELNLLAQGRAQAGTNMSPLLVKYQAYFSPARPIYTLRAKVADKALPPLTRKAMIALFQVPVRRKFDFAVLMWRSENWGGGISTFE